jgi:hypothetical protein
LIDPSIQVTRRRALIAVSPETVEAFLEQIRLHHAPVQPEQFVQQSPFPAVQVDPAAEQQSALAFDRAAHPAAVSSIASNDPASAPPD